MRIIIPFLFLLMYVNGLAQRFPEPESPKTFCVTGAIQQNGESVINFEAVILNELCFQIGAGNYGMGGSLNYHIKEPIRSSFFSLQYWGEGFGTSNYQRLIGPSFTYRGNCWFTAQVGLGYCLDRGFKCKINPGFEAGTVPVVLTCSAGVYYVF
jgi:hypothetical protein